MHTIIITKDSYLLCLKKYSYEISLKDICDNYKNKILSFILSNRIFKDLDQKLFKITYVSLFFNEVTIKHQKILIQEEPNEFVYLIRNGDFVVSFKKSLMDLNLIIKYYGFNPIKEKITENEDSIITFTN